jgi:hypothetical protein
MVHLKDRPGPREFNMPKMIERLVSKWRPLQAQRRIPIEPPAGGEGHRMNDMDRPEGFFPERRILAMRRQQRRPPQEPVQSAVSWHKAMWIAVWIVFGTATFSPIWIAIWGTYAVRRPGVLLVVCYVLAVLALAGVAIGFYRGFRSGKRFARV